MGFENENMWSAMKGPHYERIADKIRRDLEAAENMEDVLAASLCSIVKAANAKGGTFWFYDRFGDEKIRAKACCGGVDLRAIELGLGEGIVGRVIATGKSMMVADCQSESSWCKMVDEKTGYQTLSMISVPMSWKNKCFGCIQILNKANEGNFDEIDLKFVTNFAAYISELYKRFNLLESYEDGVEVEAKVLPEFKEHTLASLLDMDSFADVEYELMLSPRFNHLPINAQKSVLRHVREIWLVLQKNPPLENSKSLKELFF